MDLALYLLLLGSQPVFRTFFLVYIRLLCFAVTEQLDMNIKSKKNLKHIYNNTMQCNIIRGLHVLSLHALLSSAVLFNT